jgi:hypothetical protein
MFGWIPILGPIIDGIVSIFTKFQDTSIGKYKVDGTVDVEAIKASTQITEDFKDDVGVRLARDIIMFPVAIWTLIISWDNIVRANWPDLYLEVKAYPPSVEYLPYAVITFLFGVTAMKIWRGAMNG